MLLLLFFQRIRVVDCLYIVSQAVVCGRKLSLSLS